MATDQLLRFPLTRMFRWSISCPVSHRTSATYTSTGNSSEDKMPSENQSANTITRDRDVTTCVAVDTSSLFLTVIFYSWIQQPAHGLWWTYIWSLHAVAFTLHYMSLAWGKQLPTVLHDTFKNLLQSWCRIVNIVVTVHAISLTILYILLINTI